MGFRSKLYIVCEYTFVDDLLNVL